MTKKTKIICVVGPTASGKTALGVKIAKAIGGEVISADSMQIYRDMHIASAAADQSETEGVPHHLLEFLPYGSEFTVFDFLQLAKEKIADITSRGKVPVIVGGTGLYINSLVDNIELAPVSSDKSLRAELEAEADRIGTAEMLKRLKELDPQAAELLHENDRKRIIRAFELIRGAGITPTEQKKRSRLGGTPYDATLIGITYNDRQKLYDRINLRVDIMLQKGLLQEARRAYDRRNDILSGAAQAIGHKEFFGYFDGDISLEEATERLKMQTRRYAKRQLTWFRARGDINWVYPDVEDAFLSAKDILKREGYKL